MSHLTTLRQTPQPSPADFLREHAGCWIEYYDDTSTGDHAKAMSVRSFDPAVAGRKQREGCAVRFSLQPFGKSRTHEGLLGFQNMGANIDLVAAVERGALADEEIDRRKEDYFTRRLLPFPLKPHWLVETRHGFHAIFRVVPLRSPEGIRNALSLNVRLVRALGADPDAVRLAQVVRVPGTEQFSDPRCPFLCRLLLDNTPTIRPYTLSGVRGFLDTWEKLHEPGGQDPHEQGRGGSSEWMQHLKGVPEGECTAAATAIAEGILHSLPNCLWQAAGWAGLKEWNTRNNVPLPEQELRHIFEGVTRQERSRRSDDRRDHDGRLGSAAATVASPSASDAQR
ncbi:MAG: hypothetical protein L0Z62_16565 [Gemmataceae bacterium]|nr:hypothetical protein [Gemmataceae bacterium]